MGKRRNRIHFRLTDENFDFLCAIRRELEVSSGVLEVPLNSALNVALEKYRRQLCRAGIPLAQPTSKAD
jgi:hypothetical protein